MEQDLKSAAQSSRDRQPAGTPAALNGKPNLKALKDPGRLSPAIAFASAKALFALPVNWRQDARIWRFRGVGGVEKGISLANAAGASTTRVTRGCDRPDRCQRNAFFHATDAVGTAKFAHLDAIYRQGEQALAEAKAMAGLSRPGSLRRLQVGLAVERRGRALQAGGLGCLGRAFQVLLHFGDQALQAVGLARQRKRPRPPPPGPSRRALLALAFSTRMRRWPRSPLILSPVDAKLIALGGDGLAQANDSSLKSQRWLCSASGPRSEQHCRAKRLQCVSAAPARRRRAAPARAGRQALRRFRSAANERGTNLLLRAASKLDAAGLRRRDLFSTPRTRGRDYRSYAD